MKSSIIIGILVLFLSETYAVSYREKYKAVLTHYQKKDSKRYKAAQFLIDYMEGHFSPEGEGINLYVQKVKELQPKTNIGKLSKIWKEFHVHAKTVLVPDSMVITDNDLITNIDDAFAVWEKSPWKKDVSFQLFCEYILPYQVVDEHLSNNWRGQLRKAYQGLLDGVTDVKTAFAVIRREVLDRVSNSHTFTPYHLDVLSYEHIRRANCDQRCILLASVLRAYGIPAAIDFVPHWADYSTMGHTWVSLVLAKGSTYTVFEDEKAVKEFNRIDASVFVKNDSILNGVKCPYPIKNEKKVAKIYRKGYTVEKMDVSKYYGLNGKLEIPCKEDIDVFLCTFVTGKDWMPIAWGHSSKEKAVFENLGKGIVYLPIIMEGGKAKPLSPPLLLSNRGVHSFSKVNSDTSTVIIDRKYPLCAYMPVQWKKLISGIFEGSDNPTFETTDTLFIINDMPNGETKVDVSSKKAYRYIRFKSPDAEIALLSELQFLTKANRLIKGNYLSQGVDANRLSLLYDDDKESKIKAFNPGYWVGIDIGEDCQEEVSSILFAPVSDGNDIQKGHLYELYGYDNSWKLIGRKVAGHNNSLIFNGVPQGVLLLLKDKTKGHEERIFEYKDGKQIWY